MDLSGVVTVGGLTACGLSGIAGALVGIPMRASRDSAKPAVEDKELRRWATEQAELVPKLWQEPDLQAACGRYIKILGGETQNLLICKHRGEWRSSNDIEELKDLPDQVIFVDPFTVEYSLKHIECYELYDHVFVVDYSGYPGLLQTGMHRDVRWPRDIDTNFVGSMGHIRNTLGQVVLEAVAKAWNVDLESIITENNLEKEPEVKIGSKPSGDLVDRALVINRPKTDES